jgi:hypothetical protein
MPKQTSKNLMHLKRKIYNGGRIKEEEDGVEREEEEGGLDGRECACACGGGFS